MQRALNRIIFQRSSDFVFKIATEAATTFLAEDSSGKALQDGDDYQLIDMGEESLFMSDDDRELFLNDLFSRRLALDGRISEGQRTLPGLLGSLGVSKTEFARRLRMTRDSDTANLPEFTSDVQKRRGATKPKALITGTMSLRVSGQVILPGK